jgi:hypothetical protein
MQKSALKLFNLWNSEKNYKHLVSIFNKYFISDHICGIIIIKINMEPVDKQPNESCNSHSGEIAVVTSLSSGILRLNDIKLTTEDFISIGSQVTSLILDKCTSDQWQQILQKMADLTGVVELSITRCGLLDEHLQPLAKITRL